MNLPSNYEFHCLCGQRVKPTINRGEWQCTGCHKIWYEDEIWDWVARWSDEETD